MAMFFLEPHQVPFTVPCQRMFLVIKKIDVYLSCHHIDLMFLGLDNGVCNEASQVTPAAGNNNNRHDTKVDA